MTRPDSAPPQPLVLTLSDAAGRLRVSVKTVHRLVAQGQLPIVKIRSRSLVRPDDLAAFLSERATRRVA